MSIAKAIKELKAMEQIGLDMAKRAHDASVYLEQLSAPVPSGIKKKQVISEAEQTAFVTNFRTSLRKRKTA
ncbi:MAG: hypothetical protein WKF88_05575 [Ferruginibacter sp.]